MKRKILIIAILCMVFHNLIYTQHSVEANYNKVYIGRNFSLSHKYNFNKLSIISGVSFHVNRLPTPLSTLLKNGAHTQNFGQHFGIIIGLNYSLYKNNYVLIGLNYTNHISNISQIIHSYPAIGSTVPNPQSESDFIYTYSQFKFGPVLTTDNALGLSIKAKLSENLYLSTLFSAGIILWKYSGDEILLFAGKKPNQGWVISSQFSLGLGYTFRKK